MTIKKDNKLKLSASTVAFISYRCRLTKVLAGAAKGEMGSKGGGGRMRLLDVDTWELAGFHNESIRRFLISFKDCV